MSVASVTSFFLHISAGWVALAVLCALALFDSLRGGTSRTTSLALAFPLTYLLLTFVADASLMSGIAKQFSSAFAQGLFAALVLGVAFVLMYRFSENFSDVGFLQALAAALGLVVMAALFWQLIPAFNTLWSPGAQVAAVFAAPYRFWWLLTASVALSFAKS